MDNREYGRPISFMAAAKQLNDRNITSPTGAQWSGTQIVCMARRLGLDPPLARISPKLSPVLVKELWEKQPDITAPTLLKMLGPKIPLGLDRAMELLTACRTAEANRSILHKRIGSIVERICEFGSARSGYTTPNGPQSKLFRSWGEIHFCLKGGYKEY